MSGFLRVCRTFATPPADAESLSLKGEGSGRRQGRGRLLAISIASTLLFTGAAAGASERLVHEENISTASRLDPAYWAADTGFFRNKEAQYYRPDNVAVRDGLLILEARRETALNAAYDPNGADWLTTTRQADYTSASIVTRDAFLYGVFEIVARLPQSEGTWPAIWMIQDQGLPYREIDLIEAIGGTPDRIWSTIHAGPDLEHLKHWQNETPMPNLAAAFHVFRLEWRRDAIVISVDGHETLRMNPEDAHRDGVDPLRAPMHLRLNLALGGSWGGKIDPKALPARFEVKSIRIWSFEP